MYSNQNVSRNKILFFFCIKISYIGLQLNIFYISHIVKDINYARYYKFKFTRTLCGSGSTNVLLMLIMSFQNL